MRQILTRKLALVRAGEHELAARLPNTDSVRRASERLAEIDSPRRPGRSMIAIFKAALTSRIRVRAETNFIRGINLIWVVQMFAQEYSSFRKSEIMHMLPPSRLDMRGGSRSSRNARRDAMDAKVLTDEQRFSRTAKLCGPGTPWLVSSSRTDAFASRGRR